MLVKDMLQYVQDVKVVKGMGQGLSDHHIVLCKIRLVGAWIKSKKLRDHQYRRIS